jgi:hypothetical protein
VFYLFTKQLRDSGLPADVLEGRLNKNISFALRRGTIAQVTTALDAAQRAVEDIVTTPLLEQVSSSLCTMRTRRAWCALGGRWTANHVLGVRSAASGPPPTPARASSRPQASHVRQPALERCTHVKPSSKEVAS